LFQRRSTVSMVCGRESKLADISVLQVASVMSAGAFDYYFHVKRFCVLEELL
jgi:hypothetical protein